MSAGIGPSFSVILYEQRSIGREAFSEEMGISLQLQGKFTPQRVFSIFTQWIPFPVSGFGARSLHW